MKNTENNSSSVSEPENQWNAYEVKSEHRLEDQEEYSFFGDYEQEDSILPLQVSSGKIYPDDDDEEEEEEDENSDDGTQEGDWGHVDPAESNNPFYDPNAPTAPGSAV